MSFRSSSMAPCNISSLTAGAMEHPAAWRLCEDYDLSASLVFIHTTVGFDDVVQAKNPAHRDRQTASGYLLDQFLQRHMHEIFRLARIARKTDSSRYDLHG